MRSLLLSLTAAVAARRLARALLRPIPARCRTGRPGQGCHRPARPAQRGTAVAQCQQHQCNEHPEHDRAGVAEHDLGSNATASDYLRAAQNALAAGQTGRAQEALENAETRLLTRSTPMGMSGQPDQNPAVNNINSALQSLGSHDVQGAMRIVQQTIPMTDQMQTAATGPMGTAPMATGPMGTPGPTTTP